MQPQYTQLYALQGNLFSPGSPVVVVSGTLLQNSQTGQPFAQLILENIGPAPIVSIKLELTGLDPADRPLTQPMEHYLLDVNAPRGSQFGGASLFPMPHPAVRSFSFRILEIIFADKTIWTGEDCLWQPLPASRSLEAVLADDILVTQYRLEYGPNCRFAPIMLDELYLCSCGAPNRHQHTCAHCGSAPAVITDALVAQLREKANLRLEEEAKQAEEQRKLEEERQAQQAEEQARKAEERQKKKEEHAEKWKKTKKKLIRVAIAVPICLVLIFALLVATHFWILPEINYRLALNSIERGDYENAYRLFTILDDYRDTEDYRARFVVRETLYESTNEYMQEDLYDYESDTPTRRGSTTRREYKYDEHGYNIWYKQTKLELKNGRYVESDEPTINDDPNPYTYNSKGNPIERNNEDGSRTVYSYNGSGLLTKREAFDKDGKLTEKTLYTYNSAGLLTKEEVYEDGELLEDTSYSYNADGEVTKEVYNDWEANTTGTGTYEYNSKNLVTKYVYQLVNREDAERNYTRTTTYTYTLTGKPKTIESESTRDTDFSYSYTYTYNIFDQLTEYEYVYNYKTSRTKRTYTISYNTLGHMTEVEGVYKSYDLEEDTSYTQKQSATVTCRLDGTMKEVKLTTVYSGDTYRADQGKIKTTIEYDGCEREISRKTTYESGNVEESETEYQYFYFPEGTLKPSEY